jgi:hypothetical protein
MKRLYNYAALSLLFVSFGSLSAQSLNPGPILPPSKQINTEQLRTRFETPERSVGEWLFFDVAYDNYFIVTPVAGFVNFLFPDSTILTNPSAPFPTWTHAVGQAYDLNSPAWIGTTVPNLDFSQPIKIDSILVWGFYLRVNPSTDTLRVNFYEPTSGTSGNLYNPFFFTGGSTLANLGVDTAYFLNMAYDFPTNTVPNPTQQWDVILDNTFWADSLADGTHQHIIVPSTPLTMTLNDPGVRTGVFGFYETFIPGYTWNANVDVIGQDQNGYRPIAAEFNGTDSYPTLTENRDLTTSYLLPRDVRYNLSPAPPGWNGKMIPMMAYTAPFNWEYIYIVPYISQATSASLDENEEIDFNIYPNPATTMTNVNVASAFASDATINLIDLSGKVVKQFTNYKVNIGNNVFNLDLNDVDNGAYIIQLNSNGHQLSSKLMISK